MAVAGFHLVPDHRSARSNLPGCSDMINHAATSCDPLSPPRGAPLRIDARFAAAQAVATSSKPQEPGRQRFSLDGSAAGKARTAGSAVPLANLDAILALQEEEDPSSRGRRSARRGKALLDALDGLKAGLLSGSISGSELTRIAGNLRAGAGPSGDPGLDDVVSQIELRAKVELAKLGRADLI